MSARPIKFRAWDKRDGQMKEVWSLDYRHRDDGYVMVKMSSNKWDRVLKPAEWGNSRDHVVLMQFTGLTDKNGKEIYEGDVLQLESDEGIDEYPHYVKHIEEVTFAKAAFWGIFSLPLWELMDTYKNVVEVTGNIYENPDLIGRDKKGQQRANKDSK